MSRHRPCQEEGRVREGQVQATRGIHSVAQPAVLSARAAEVNLERGCQP